MNNYYFLCVCVCVERDWREMTSARAPPQMPFLGYSRCHQPNRFVVRRRRDGDHAASPTTTSATTRVHDRFDFDTHVTHLYTHVTFDHDDFPARITAIVASSANNDYARAGSGTVSIVSSRGLAGM